MDICQRGLNMVSVIKRPINIKTLYHVMFLIEDKGSGLPVVTTNAAADGVEASGHRWHDEE